MSIELDYSDIIDIFKNHLKIENSVKSISHTFLNKRYTDRIDYAPYFQRKYVWDAEKSSYFIESILLGTEIPPIVLFDNGEKNEVIDGRQRYETIKKFLDNKLVLDNRGLKVLSEFSGSRFNELPENIQYSFLSTKIRILQFSVVNEPSLSPEQEDKVKKEIFARYNSGIIALKQQEIERAAYISNPLVRLQREKLEQESDFLEKCQVVLMPKRKQNISERDRINYVLTRMRYVLAMQFVPIQSYAAASSKSDVIHSFYYTEVSKKKPEENMIKFVRIINKLHEVRETLAKGEDSFIKDNNLFYETLYWGLSIIEEKTPRLLDKINMSRLARDILDCAIRDAFWTNISIEKRELEMIFFATGSHYYKSIINRYTFVGNYLSSITGTDFSENIKNKSYFDNIMLTDLKTEQHKEFKLSKADPVSATVYDIISDLKESNFVIRPDYQRSEVPNAIQKASYLMESILLGIRIPPIFIYRKNNKVSEVIDGQQRLLSILGFLRESYKDVNSVEQKSDKDNYKLTKLRFLKELNNKNIDDIEKVDKSYKDRILDFQIDIVEINQDQNPNFNPIDLFLRLNSKPFPIETNSFEMWNAFVTKEYVERIKKIASEYAGSLFRPLDTRMKNEELITILAYLSYQKRKNATKLEDLLNIYAKNQRINARIKNKNSITNVLGEISRSNDTVFTEALADVEEFIIKLQILTGSNFEKLNEMIVHTKGTRQSRTNQNFYLLWIAIAHNSIAYTRKNRIKIFEKISNMFAISQDIRDDDFCIDDFVSDLSSI